MLCLSGFELYSRWVPLLSASSHNINMPLLELIVTQILLSSGLKTATPLLIFRVPFHFFKRTNPALQKE